MKTITVDVDDDQIVDVEEIFKEVKTVPLMPVDMLDRCMKKFGQKVVVQRKGFTPRTISGFVQGYSRNRRNEIVDTTDQNRFVLGLLSKYDKVAYFPYKQIFNDDNDDPIRITFRGRSYEVMTLAPVYLTDRPLYVWCIMRRIDLIRSDYDDLDHDEGGDADG